MCSTSTTTEKRIGQQQQHVSGGRDEVSIEFDQAEKTLQLSDGVGLQEILDCGCLAGQRLAPPAVT